MNVKFSIRLFTCVLIATGILLVFIGIYDYQAQQAVNSLKERYLQIEQLRGMIIHYDEIMTMSARMAAATGDTQWEGRYREYKPKLSDAILQAMLISPEIFRKETDRSGMGKIRLMDMEDRAFNLIRESKSQQAMDILFGAEYEAQRNNYERTVESLSGLLKKQMDAALAVENSKENMSRTAFITVFILLLLSWLVLLRIARSTQEALVDSHRRLDELNKTLDQKVRERTNDLQKVQNQLLQAEKFSAIGQLAAGIAHEINNPIGFINCNLHTLEKYAEHYSRLLGFLNKLEKALNDRDVERMGQVISSWDKYRKETNFKFIEGDIGNLIRESMEGAESIAKIVSNLRTFSRPDKGQEHSIDIRTLMDSMLTLAWNEIKYKAQLRKDYASVPPVVCNPQQIGQVFISLLTNAAQAIQDKGFITVRTYTRNQYVCVDVCDTGCGILPENSNKIFDPFFTTKPPGRGVGLGLSASYDIVRRYGGDITFSPNADKGTTFTVMLPLEHEEAATGVRT